MLKSLIAKILSGVPAVPLRRCLNLALRLATPLVSSFTSQLLVPAVELKFQDAHLLVFQTVCSILKGKVDANIGLRLSRRKAQEQSSKR